MIYLEGADHEKHNNAITKSRREALRTVQTMSLPKRIYVSSESFISFRGGLARTAKRILDELKEEYGEKLPYLMGIALRECHYEACCAGYFIAESTAYTTCTPETYVQNEGWAYTLYNGCAEITEHSEQAIFREDTPFVDRISSETLLKCMALYWFSQASRLNQNGDALAAQELIFEAMDAVNLSDGIFMWNEGFEAANEDDEGDVLEKNSVKGYNAQKAMLSAAGRLGASRKNEPIRQLKKWALEKATEMRASHKDIARRLSAELPIHLADVSKDPERLIYDTLRAHSEPN